MRRFYADKKDVHENRIVIRGSEANHIKNVVRMQEGDEFVTFDGTGTDYTCRITGIGTQIEADIISREQNASEPDIGVTLYQAYPKSAKMEDIVQKAVELGAKEIVPFISKRCVKIPGRSIAERLERVVLSAAKQCGRSVLTKVTDVLSFDAAMELMKRHDMLIVCWEEEKVTPLKRALKGQALDIGIVIGSEGGFEENEIKRMRDIGGISVTIGPRILRTETAGIAVMSAVFYEKGQMEY